MIVDRGGGTCSVEINNSSMFIVAMDGGSFCHCVLKSIS